MDEVTNVDGALEEAICVDTEPAADALQEDLQQWSNAALAVILESWLAVGQSPKDVAKERHSRFELHVDSRSRSSESRVTVEVNTTTKDDIDGVDGDAARGISVAAQSGSGGVVAICHNKFTTCDQRDRSGVW